MDCSWLKKWKLRADRDERREMEEQKEKENGSSKSWRLSHFISAQGQMLHLMSHDLIFVTLTAYF